MLLPLSSSPTTGLAAGTKPHNDLQLLPALLPSTLEGLNGTLFIRVYACDDAGNWASTNIYTLKVTAPAGGTGTGGGTGGGTGEEALNLAASLGLVTLLALVSLCVGIACLALILTLLLRRRKPHQPAPKGSHGKGHRTLGSVSSVKAGNGHSITPSPPTLGVKSTSFQGRRAWGAKLGDPRFLPSTSKGHISFYVRIKER